MMLDFFLCLIWLPIRASQTYGLRSTHDAFMTTCMCIYLRWYREIDLTSSDNGTGAPPAWNWILSLYVTMLCLIELLLTICSVFSSGVLTGFDAAGHVAEETKNARYDMKNNGLIITDTV
jgi:hypothetical protein